MTGHDVDRLNDGADADQERPAMAELMEIAPITMTPDSFEVFLAEISGPPGPVPAMVELLRRTPPWRTDSLDA